MQFIDLQATVDDDDDDDEDEEAEDGFEYNDDLEVEPTSRDRALYGKVDAKRQQREEESAEIIAERMKQRYGRSEASRGGFRGDLEHVPQDLLIPSVHDPKLWLVKCKPGAEKTIIFNLCRKAFDIEFSNRPMQIMSCFTRDNLKGYIYLEAEKQAHVVEAIDKMNNMYGSRLQLVPVNEMVDCLRTKPKELDIKLGMWIRIKRGKYEGDLAKVLDISESGDNVTVKLIPRLDYSRDATKRKKGANDIRHPQKLFNPHDVNKREVTASQGGFTYQGEFFDKDGYLEKLMKLTSIESKNVNPTLDEITRFSGGMVNDRSEELARLSNPNVATGEDFQNGEKVIVLSGEMRNVPGVVHSVDHDVVTIIPDKSYGLANFVQYAASEIAKRFVEGDHAKVMSGIHKDQSGLVLKVDNNVVTLLCDSTLKPIEIFSKDLRTATDATAIVPSTSQYDIYDLVQLSPNELGVIVKIEKDIYTLLDPYGNISRIKPQQIRSKRDSSRAVTSDTNGRPIGASDTVIVLDDQFGSRKQAEVLHIYRSFVYLKSKDVIENGGVFVTKSSNVAILTAKMSSNSNNMPANQIVQSSFGSRGGARGGRGGGRGFRDPLRGKTVTVVGGPYKGYLGIVKDVTETHARVELHTHSRTINIEKEKLKEQGAQDSYSSRRPDYKSNTARYEGSRTPMHGSKTPMVDNDSRSSAWNAGSKTPAYESGSRTLAWDAGSKTPAYDAASKTPAWDAPSTPAWEAGSRTPARDADGFRNIATPNAAPATPGYLETHDISTPYVPATPGVFPTTPAPHSSSHTPYPSMNSSAATPATPFVQDINTPLAIPSTPAANQDYYNHQATVSQTGKNWITSNIQVVVISSSKGNFAGGKYDNQTGSCTSVSDNKATISFSNGDNAVIPQDFLKPIAPQKKEQFKVIKGEGRGKVGHLLSIDGQEGVVRIDGNEDILMMNLDCLAKLSVS
ncbi:hypothetical protein BC833DRAFT_605194 [Globomyces pollinis-pini]|nr:hypothetical protein BC833DRAFT_605194 [Globomyces pollinis-pini]